MSKKGFLQILDAQRPDAPYIGTPNQGVSNNIHSSAQITNLLVQMPWSDERRTGDLLRI